MFVRASKYTALQAEVERLQAENERLVRENQGCQEHRARMARNIATLRLRLPGEVHDKYRELARTARDSCLPQTPADPVFSREESSARIRAVLRQLEEAGENFEPVEAASV
jgi:FtsZ-binding cell division protein ZapB